MSRISFFTMLVDDRMSWIERDAINDAQAQADTALAIAQSNSEAHARSIQTLGRQLAAQGNQIKMLNAAIGVLAAVLRDNNVIDPEILDARLEAAVLNAEEEIAQAAAKQPMETCSSCAAQVPRNRTNMTATSVVCDRCAAGA